MSLPETQAKLPTLRERQFMQHLRAGGWVRSSSMLVSAGPTLIASLLKKRVGSNNAVLATRFAIGLRKADWLPRRCHCGFTIRNRRADPRGLKAKK